MEEVLVPRLRAGGPLPFDEFMELALYHEDHGYYSDPARTRVGRGGDFATNVSVGETFGRLLARRLHQFWLAHGSPPVLHVCELGPEDGSLALDLLKWARVLSPEFHAALRYRACEHSPRKRAALASRFAAAGEPHLTVGATPTESLGPLGVILANEVLDALPVSLLRFADGRWHSRCVTLADHALAWTDDPGPPPAFADTLGTRFPDCYQTEFCPRLPGFFQSLAPLFDRALVLLCDYGFVRADYYHPDRTAGTLRTYADHLPGDDPLDAPGRRDLTAHVDFTAALAAARSAGFDLLGFARQESYLTAVAEPLLRSLPDHPDSASFLRQFRTLTHPGFFGSRFHVLELATRDLAPGFPFPCRSNLTGLE